MQTNWNAKAYGTMTVFRAFVFRKAHGRYPRKYRSSYGENTLDAAIMSGSRDQNFGKYEVFVERELYLPSRDNRCWILQESKTVWSSTESK